MLKDDALKIIEAAADEIESVEAITPPLESMLNALDRYVVKSGEMRQKRADFMAADKGTATGKKQVCRYMQLQDYYASDCPKCRGKAIICNSPDVIDIHGKEARDVAIELKRSSFPLHMSERRCNAGTCKYFEAEETT